MKTILRRTLAAAATLVALLAAPLALATPTITITSPTSGSTIASISTPAGFLITGTATATATAGVSISSVQLFDNGVSIGSIGGGSINFTWTPSTSGLHVLTATVTDNSVVTSGSLNTATATSIVTVTNVRTVAVTSPVNNATVAQDSSVFLRSTAVLSDSVVASVQFRVDGVNVGAAITQAPYNTSVVLSAANGFGVGSHNLTAVATNGDGSITSTSPVSVVNIAAPIGAAPTVTLSTTASGGVVQVNQNVTLSASASDADGFIPATAGGGVTFFVDGDPVVPAVSGETNPDLIAPYSVTWKPSVAKSYALQAQTIDDKNNVTLSAIVNVTATAATVAPTVSMTNPTAGSTLGVGSAVSLTATATANSGATVTKVDFLSGSTVLGTSTTAPHSFTWTPTAAGTFSLTARVTDSNNAVVTSAAVSVTVITSAPTVSITAPTNGASVALGTSTTVTATAVANGGATVSRVDFIAGSTTVGTALAPTAGSSFSITWTPTAAGITALTARVTDSNGTAVTSTIVNVNVTAPIVALTAPTAGAGVTVGTATSLSAVATAASGTVSKVDFFAGTTLVGTVNSPASGATSTVSWTPTATGAVSLTARVTDSNSAVITSSAVNVTVAASVPTIAMTSHANGASIPLGTSPTLTASAVAFGGATVLRVDFLAGTTTIGSSLAPTAGSNYQVSWTPTASGITALTAKVTDSNGTIVTSSTVNVSVTAPTVALTAPAGGSGATLGSAVSLSAVATAASGTISRVDFFAGATLVGTVNNPVSGATSTVSWTPTATGAVSLTARVTDSNTAVITSAAVAVTVATSVPTITITSHANGASIPLGTSPTLTATATAPGATVTRVDFLAGATTIASVLSPTSGSSYQVSWTPSASGITALTAKVTDSNGTTITSSTVNVSVTAPTVALTAPAGGSGVTLGSAVSLNAVATAATGTISRVDFFAGATLVGTVNNPVSGVTSTVNWTPSAAGAVALIARVTDSNGAVVTSAAVNVTAAASGLSVAITSPNPNATVTGNSSVTISASATVNAPATIASVAFFVDGNQVGIDTTAPYAITWTAAPAGLHAITAVVTDNGGITASATGINVNVSTVALPTIFITAPISASSFIVGSPITVSATTAAGSSGTITRVDFFADTVAIGTDTTAPYSISWTPTTTGAPNINARVTDSNGVTANAVPVPIVVNSASTPTVSLAFSPVSGSTVIPVASSRVLLATVADSGAIDRVEFYYDSTLLGSARNAPYSFVFSAPLDVGAHQLTARAINNLGLTTTSNVIAINVAGIIGNPPTATILAPSANAALPVGVTATITGNSTDSDGTVSSVQVYASGALIGNATIAGNLWTLAWTPTGVGPVALVAVATDDKLNAFATSATTVNVTDATSPSIALSFSPATAANPATTTLPAGAIRNILATVTPSSGRAVSRVEFFVNGTKVADKTGAPYSYRYKAEATPGTSIVTVRATDNTGLSRDVQQTFTITSAVGVAPTVNLLAPTTGAVVVPNSSIPVNLAAAALASGGTISSLQFYANGSPLAINGGNGLTSAPYISTFNPNTTGSYVLDAIATDDRGNTTVSNAVTITAAFGTPTIAITAPNANATARATPLIPFTITVTATGGTGAQVLLVEYLLDGVQIGTRTTPSSGTSYSFQWTPTVAQLGNRLLTARVTDTNSLTATSTPSINVNVANIVGTPPTLQINSPGNGSVIQNASTVNFVATSNVGASTPPGSVEFFLNDVSIGLGAREQSTNVYRRVFDFSTFDLSSIVPDGNGRYPVSVYAIARDTGGNQTVSSTFTVSVAPAQSLPPSISLQPFGIGGGGNTVTQGTNFFLFAQPTDSDGTVTSLQLLANGVIVGGSTVNNPPAQTAVFYTANTVGRINLVAVVTDDSGNTTVSNPAIVLDVTALRAPSTALTRPSDDSTVTTVGTPVFLEATANSPDGTQTPIVGFFATSSTGNRITITNNAQRVSPTSNVYRFVWTPVTTTADSFTVSSSATVGFGTGAVTTNSSQTRRVAVNLVSGISPTVNFVVQGATTSASRINLIATANDSDGSVNGVEFYVDRNSIGQAVREQLTSTWRLSTSLVGLPLGNTEIVALVRDNSGNVAASTTSIVNITAATSLAPTISAVTASPNSVAFSRQVQLTASASDTDGTVSVQYFANGAAIGTATNANNNYLLNWTPTASGTFNIYAVATDNGVNGSTNTSISPTIQVTVRRNNPIQDDTAFILQAYADIANVTNINPLVLADLADRLAAKSVTRSQIVTDLIDDTGFVSPVNILAAYWVLMGQWPTPANYTTLLSTTRNQGLSNGIGSILSSNEYFAKYGVVPTSALLNNPASAIPADTFINNLWKSAGLGAPSSLQNLQFRSNNVSSATLGRGYNVGGVGLNTALAEFITLTNSTNTALFNQARAAALYYQIDRPPTPTNIPVKEITDGIAARVAALVKLPDDSARVDAVLKDNLYTYRYITFVKHPESLVVSPRSGAIFNVEAIGAPPILYQWLFNGTPILNANSSVLSLTNVDVSRVGTYTVVVTTNAGSVTSDPSTLTLSNNPTRVGNISTRGVTNGGNQVLIAGFVVANAPGAPANQTRQMLIRVVGPTLSGAPFNVTGVLANPLLEVYNAAGQQILTNDNWGTQNANAVTNATAVTAIQQAAARVSAFTLAPTSLDAVVLATLPAGSYTVQARGPNPNSSGVVLIEVYDATAGTVTATSPKASNVATRGEVGTGGNVLIAGFVINGTAARRMLIRGVGPTLTRFGLGQNAVLADPFLTLKDSSGVTLRTSDDWGSGDDAAVIASAAVSGGAFPLANGSKDAAMIIMLQPGAYTVQLSGVNNGTGIGIVEVYDVDP